MLTNKDIDKSNANFKLLINLQKSLVESGTEFTFSYFPDCNNFTINIYNQTYKALEEKNEE